jgi:endonuclease/exonuclease/phosphatase family metal-dependent hydrolase
MRRIASAIGPVLALVAVTVPTTPAHALVPHATQPRAQHSAEHASTSAGSSARTSERTSARHRSRIGLDSTSLGTSYINVSWNWIRAASGYRIQVAKKKSFTRVVTNRNKRNSARRPAGGREATRVGHLRDATYYWVRVRKVKGHHKSRWSAPVRVATRAHVPDKIKTAHGLAGIHPGETRLRWKSAGGHTDFYRITTALTPFGSARTPATGRHSTTFKVGGNRHSVTLTPEQTARAGAGLGTGRHLFFRIAAVRKGEADTASRPYPFLGHTTVAGQGPTGNGPALRFASYNLHVASKDVPGHPWRDRAPLVAKNLAHAAPDVVALEEMLPSMWDNRAGGRGLGPELRSVDMGRYLLTEPDSYSNSPGDSRILYDPTKVTMTGACATDPEPCTIRMPDPSGKVRLAAYAQFEVKGTTEKFWFVSAHLNPGNAAKIDSLRGRQAQAIVAAMSHINSDGIPVIVGGDFNSSQTSNGKDAPHTAFLKAGYFNTSAARRQINLQYNSVNAYKSPQRPSNYGFGSMIDSILTLGMRGASTFKQWRTTGPYPSDHNLITTDLRLP